MSGHAIRGSWFGAFVTLAGVIAILASCTPVGRYEALSFFFDGVPPPPGMEVSEEGQDLTVADEGSLIPPPAQPRATPTPVIIASRHEPYARNQCRECHNMQGRYGIPPVDATLCDQCHKEQRIREGWNHGPINLGTCIPCHKAHESRYEHLLSEPIPGLCLDCHVEVKQSAPDYHDVPEFEQCTACHDPHLMY